MLSDNWIADAIDHVNKGALHKALHVPEGQKIPEKKLEKASHSKDPHMRKMVNFAKNIKKKGR